MEFEVVESVAVDMHTHVIVGFIDKDVPFYEYSIEKDGEILELSDRSYSNPIVALRDGLSHWLGDK